MSAAHRLSPDRYVDAVRAESARFADVLGGVAPETRVQTCPEWDVGDLVWHLTEVQWFWGQIVAERPAGPEGVAVRRPERPADHAGLLALFRRCSSELTDALAAAAASDPAWSWLESDQTVGFSQRRQAHEALIHRVDAELVAGARGPLDPALATDGVDEALAIMFGGIPPWAEFAPGHGPVEVLATDTGARWVTDVGRQSGTDPDGEVVDEATLALRADGEVPLARVSADADTLDAWLWGRVGDDAVDTSGDDAALAAFVAVIRTGIE